MGIGYSRLQGIHPQDPGSWLEKVNDCVHPKSGKIFIQLWYVGRMSHPDFLEDALPLVLSVMSISDKIHPQRGNNAIKDCFADLIFVGVLFLANRISLNN